MNKEIEPCIQQVEQLLRGAGSTSNAVHDLKSKAARLLSWYSTSKAVDEYEGCSDMERNDVLALAVKLHNKSRNLSSSAHAEIRTCLKAAAAWILSIYGGDKTKVLSAVISILSKSGEELANIDEHAEMAVKCLSGAVLYYNRVMSLSLQKSLSPIELQDLKLAAFYAGLEKSQLVWKRNGPIAEVKKAVSGAAELMQILPARVKLTFAERVATIAKGMTETSELLDDTIHFFKLALNAVDSALLPAFGSDTMDTEGKEGDDAASTALTNAAEVRTMRLHLQLSLAFLYMQAKDFSKALGCVSVIEDSVAKEGRSIDTIAHTIQYAKFMIFLRDGDGGAMEAALWRLLQLPLTPFKMALSAVKALGSDPEGTGTGGDTVTSGATLDLDATLFYRHLASNYPNEPEYTQVRLSHLQYILATSREAAEGQSSNDHRALEISSSIIAAHTKRERVLSGEHYSQLCALLTDRIRWLRSLQRPEHHTAVLEWCTVLLALMSENADERSSCAALLVVQCDSLMRLHRLEEAVIVATRAWQTLPNTRTIVMRFTAILHAEAANSGREARSRDRDAVGTPVDVAVKALCEMHHIGQSSDATALATAQEQLARIILCCQMCQQAVEVDEPTRDATSQRLLAEWLQLYASTQAWRSVATEPDGEVLDLYSGEGKMMDGEKGAAKESTYLRVLCDLLHLFFKHRLFHTLRTDTRDSGEAKPIGSPACTTGANSGALLTVSTPMVTTANTQSDLFVTTGYPDCLQHLSTHSEGFTFHCTATELRTEVLPILEEALSAMVAVQKESLPLTALGSVQDLSWLCNLAYNIGTLLAKHGFGATRRDRVTESGTEDGERDCLVCAARLFELGELLMEKLGSARAGTATSLVEADAAVGQSRQDSASPTDLAGDRALSLLVACSCRIDAETGSPGPTETLPFGSHSAPSAPNCTTSIPSNNLVQARLAAQKAGRLLQCGVDFEDSRCRNLQASALLLEFDAMCRLGDTGQCSAFLREHQSDFLRLSPVDLKRCADTARLTGKVSTEVVRDLLNTTLQCLMRSAAHPGTSGDLCVTTTTTTSGRGYEYYALLGGVFRELIELSPTRRQALEKIEEFAQLAIGSGAAASVLATTTRPTGNAATVGIDAPQTPTEPNIDPPPSVAPHAVAGFLPEDIDHIVSLAYNYGVTLVDLDQTALAEKFLCRAMNLLTCASPAVKGWLPRIQETYAHVLQARADVSRALSHTAVVEVVGKVHDSAKGDEMEGDSAELGPGTGGGKKRSAAAAGLPQAQVPAQPPQVRDAPLQLDIVK